MSTHATGAKAWGLCGRCGLRQLLKNLLVDGQNPNLLVGPECRDEKHPTEKPFRADDAQALKRPSPDVDDDSPGDSGQTLSQAMGWTRMMGGEE